MGDSDYDNIEESSALEKRDDEDSSLARLMEGIENATPQEHAMLVAKEHVTRKKGDIDYKINEKKARFLENLAYTKGVVIAACKMTKVSNFWYYHHRKQDPVFAGDADEIIRSIGVSYVEGKLMENIAKGYEASIFFYLNNRGQHLGYGKEGRGAGVAKNEDLKELTDEQLEMELRRLRANQQKLLDE